MAGVKDILVAYNGLDTARAALATGLALAREYEAHLTGCFPYNPPEVLATAERWMTKGLTQEFKQITARMESNARGAVEQSYREITAEFEAPELLHWLKMVGNSDRAITKAARHFDLTLIGQNADLAQAATDPIHPDVVALRSGKPVLVVPAKYEGLPKARKVVIAWDGKRAAARTVGDALHLLGPFAGANILTVGKPDDKAEFWARQLCSHLERHGVEARSETLAPRVSTGRTIIDYCVQSDADLLIMGAYEHSKFSEDILGGTTNEVMAALSIPVFMAH